MHSIPVKSFFDGSGSRDLRDAADAARTVPSPVTALGRGRFLATAEIERARGLPAAGTITPAEFDSLEAEAPS